MSPDTPYFLQSVSYLPKKRQVAVEFFFHGAKITKRFAFFPVLFLPAKKEFFDFLLSQPKKNIKFYKKNDFAIEVVAASFEEIEAIVSGLSGKGLGDFAAILPERQFLLNQGWSYFDFFSFENGSLQKNENVSFESFFRPLSREFSGTFFELKKLPDGSASDFLKKIFESNLLRIPPSKAGSAPDKTGILLENWFFGNSFPLEKQVFAHEGVAPKKPLAGFVEFDFSIPLAGMLCFSHSNAGPETFCCDCCRPSFGGKNISFHSTVRAEFLVDGYYFESKNSGFAAIFHEKNPFKNKRLAQKSQWCLKSIPLGPFFKGQVVEIPFYDAVGLAGNVVKVLDFERLYWNCSLKESFFSRELVSLLALEKNLERQMVLAESKTLSQSGVLYLKPLFGSFEFLAVKLFHEVVFSHVQGIFEAVSKNHFVFPKGLCDSISALRESLLSDFAVFNEKNGVFGCVISGNSVFVKCGNPLALSSSFSDAFSLRRPLIRMH